jgi:ABC-type transport system involved in multi-copper enzyme maturation permease subunit
MNSPVLLIAFNTTREVIRNKALYAVVGFSTVIVMVAALFGSVTIGDQVTIIKDFSLLAITLGGAVIVSISGVTLLEKELKFKTIYNVLSKPVHRAEFIVGKFIGLALVSGILVSLMGIVCVFFTSLFEGRIDWLLFQAIYLVILELLLLSAVAIFFSTLVVTTLLAGLLTFGTFIAGHSHRALDYFLSSQTDQSADLSQILVKTVKFMLPDLSVFNRADQLVMGVAISPGYALSAMGYSLLFSSSLIILAALIFQRRDFR